MPTLRIEQMLLLVLMFCCGVVGTTPLAADATLKEPEPRDIDFTFWQLIQERGFEVENHTVTTADGCDLGLFRLRNQSASLSSLTVGRTPVVLQHGILDSSFAWVMNDRTESLAFILMDAGYDVWLSNSRGNQFSTGVKPNKPSSKAYWDWSWDEMAKYDIPAVINYVKKATNVNQVPIVCHSQGCTLSIAALTSGYLNDSVPLLATLGGVTEMKGCKSLLLEAIAALDADKVLAFFHGYDFLPTDKLLQWLLPGVCHETPIVCTSALWALTGYNPQNLNKTRLPFYLKHFPDGTSIFDMSHYAQLIRQKSPFQKYDYGDSENEKVYHQKRPPVYNVSAFPLTTKLMVFAGGKDTLADYEDSNWFVSSLPFKPILYDRLDSYAHTDFIWGLTANVDVYSKIVTELNSL